VKILITGGCGIIGTSLKDLPYEKVFYDVEKSHPLLKGEIFVRGDISDLELLRKTLRSCNVLIHAAGISDSQSRGAEIDERLFESNFKATKKLFDLAKELRIEKIIFLSSNHIVGMHELINAPDIYTNAKSPKVSVNEYCPDSFYGISKVFGETYGKYLADNGGPKFIALRVGSVRAEFEDHPYAYAEHGVGKGKWKKNSKEYLEQLNRLKAIWQSRRDFAELVGKCIEYDGDEQYLCFYGASNNKFCWFETSNANELLGYFPIDSSDNFQLE
jgi:NAD+ dependent glucose-6-phosphate dehydrogenase